MCDWLPSVSVCVCLREGEREWERKNVLGFCRVAPLAAADEDGWMNVNISFTLLSQQPGWFICLRCLCHFTCLMWAPTASTDGSFPPVRDYICECRLVIAVKWSTLLRTWAQRRASAAHKRSSVNMSGPPTFSSLSFIETSDLKKKKKKKRWAQGHGTTLFSATANGSSQQAGTFQPQSPAVCSYKRPLKFPFICHHQLTRHKHINCSGPLFLFSLNSHEME